MSLTAERPPLRRKPSKKEIALATAASLALHGVSGTIAERSLRSPDEQYSAARLERHEVTEAEQALRLDFQAKVDEYIERYVDTESPEYEGAETGYVGVPAEPYYQLDSLASAIHYAQDYVYQDIDVNLVRTKHNQESRKNTAELMHQIETLVQLPEFNWTGDRTLDLPQVQYALFTHPQAIFSKQQYYKGNNTITRQVKTGIINCTVARMTPIVLEAAYKLNGLDLGLLADYRAVTSTQHISTGVLEQSDGSTTIHVFEEQVIDGDPFFTNVNFNNESVVAHPLSYHFLGYLEYYRDFLTEEQKELIPVHWGTLDHDIPDEILPMGRGRDKHTEQPDYIPPGGLSSLYHHEAARMGLNFGAGNTMIDYKPPVWFKDQKSFNAIIERALMFRSSRRPWDERSSQLSGVFLTAVELYADEIQRGQYEATVQAAADMYGRMLKEHPTPEKIFLNAISDYGHDLIQLDLISRVVKKDPSIIAVWQKVGDELIRQYQAYTTYVSMHGDLPGQVITTPQRFADYVQNYQRASKQLAESTGQKQIAAVDVKMIFEKGTLTTGLLPVILFNEHSSESDIDAIINYYKNDRFADEFFYSHKSAAFLEALKDKPQKMQQFLGILLSNLWGLEHEHHQLFFQTMESHVQRFPEHREFFRQRLRSLKSFHLDEYLILFQYCPSFIPDIVDVAKRDIQKQLDDQSYLAYIYGLDQYHITNTNIEDLTPKDVISWASTLKNDPFYNDAPIDKRFIQKMNTLYQQIPTAADRFVFLGAVTQLVPNKLLIDKDTIFKEDNIVLWQTTPDVTTPDGLALQAVRFVYGLGQLSDHDLLTLLDQIQVQEIFNQLHNPILEVYWDRHAASLYAHYLKNYRPNTWRKEFADNVLSVPENIFYTEPK